jgi:hypothetical protein
MPAGFLKANMSDFRHSFTVLTPLPQDCWSPFVTLNLTMESWDIWSLEKHRIFAHSTKTFSLPCQTYLS